jgi:V/A-type H+-transporting ATPase subunit B
MTDTMVFGGQEVNGVDRIEGPIIFVEGTTNVSYDEVVEIRDGQGNLRRGRVLEVGEGTAVVQVFAGSTDCPSTDELALSGETKIPVAEGAGRADGSAPIDGGPRHWPTGTRTHG